MSEYWVPDRGTAEHFWQHEWNKHGTCISTLAPSCYDSYVPGAELVDFMGRAVELFKNLDTYEALRLEGIVPHRTKRYGRDEIQAALGKLVDGAEVTLGCKGGALNEAWYTYNVRGNLQSGEFVPVDPAGSVRSTCPKNGIKYLPK
jgi:ribonuclease T2